MIGMEDFELFGLELPELQNLPIVGIKYSTITHKLQIPFLGTENTDENNINNKNQFGEALSMTNLFIMKHNEWRIRNFLEIKEMRSVKNPDFYYTDNLMDEFQLNSRKKEHDKTVLNFMKEYIIIKKSEKVVDLFDTLMLKKSKDIAIQLCEGMEKYDTAELLKNKMKLNSIINSTYNLKIENHNNNNTNFSTSEKKDRVYNHDNNKNNNSNGNGNVNGNINVNGNGLFELSERAVKLDGYKNLEEEIRNELENYIEEENGIENQNNKNNLGENICDINIYGSKNVNQNFEKKPVIILINLI
jgi:hypothetical protein